ncbi:MAG: molybdopterin-dependent oxidoreductase [Hyphomicrobiaceae bacterium]
MKSGTQAIRTTCPRDCYDACGMLVRTDADGRVTVTGDPEHDVSRGALCAKCSLAYNGVWRDPKARLGHPLKRVGRKGEGVFQPVSWEAALAEIADRLGHIIEEHGGASVLHTHYTGTCSLIAGNFPCRFFNAIGAREVDPDTVCNKAGHAALSRMFGTSTLGFDPRTVADAGTIMIWGANPSATAPHVDRYWLDESGATVIVVDPIWHDTAAKADLHLQLRPGTDAALAFGLLNAIRELGGFDRKFLTECTEGFASVESQLDRTTPAWAATVTGVAEDDIRAAATAYVKGPSLLWLGQGFQRQRFGGNAMRAAALLPVATGQIGRPGTGLLYLNGGESRGVDYGDLAGGDLAADGPRPVSHMDLAATLAKTDTRALFTWNNNIAVSSPDQQALLNALAREDLFQVTIDLFQTGTADFADFVLPAASFLEFDDLVASYFNYSISAQAKALEPVGEALPNQEIFRRLARAMRLDAPALHESDVSIIARTLEAAEPGLTFESLKADGTRAVPREPVIPFADRKFPTRSGKIEIASDRFVRAGGTFAPEAVYDDPPGSDTLRLLSPAGDWLMNSSYGNDPRVAERARGETIYVSAEEAGRRGLAPGGRVRVSTPAGSLVMELAVSGRVPDGVALAYKSPWLKAKDGANINTLNPGLKSDLGQSTAVHSLLVTIEAV